MRDVEPVVAYVGKAVKVGLVVVDFVIEVGERHPTHR